MRITKEMVRKFNLDSKDDTYIDDSFKDQYILSQNTHLLEYLCRNEDDLYSLKVMRIKDTKENEEYLMLQTDFDTKIYKDSGNNILVEMVENPEINEKFKKCKIEISQQMPVYPNPKNCYLFNVDRYKSETLENIENNYDKRLETLNQTINEAAAQKEQMFEDYKNNISNASVKSYGTKNRDFYFLLSKQNNLSDSQIGNLYIQLRTHMGNDLGIDLKNESNGIPYTSVNFQKYMETSAHYYNQVRSVTDKETADNLFSCIDAKVLYPRYFRNAPPNILDDIKKEKNVPERSLDYLALQQPISAIREHIAAGGSFDYKNFSLEPIEVSPNKLKVIIYEGPENDLNITEVNCTYKGNSKWSRNLNQIERDSAEYFAYSNVRQKESEPVTISENKEHDTIYFNYPRNSFTCDVETNKYNFKAAKEMYEQMEKGNLETTSDYDLRAQLEKLAEIKGVSFAKENESFLDKH